MTLQLAASPPVYLLPVSNTKLDNLDLTQAMNDIKYKNSVEDISAFLIVNIAKISVKIY